MLRKREPYFPMEGEILVPIPGYEKYSISNFGRVVSFNKPIVILKRPFISVTGYYRVCLQSNGKEKNFYVHRLLGYAFIPNPESKPQINHKNGIKTDNSLENLEWATISENTTHSYDTGLQVMRRGEDSELSTITDKIALEIFNSKMKTTELMRIYNVCRGTIYRIRRGEAWAHVTGKQFESAKRVSNEIVLEISKLSDPTEQLMSKYNLSRSFIDQIRNGRIKSDITGIKFMPTRTPYKLSKAG